MDCLASLAMTEPCLALRSVIGAAFVATVTMDADARDLACMLQSFPDEAREAFQRRRSELLDGVQQLVVEQFLNLAHAVIEQAEVEHHAGPWIGRAAHRDFGSERMTVDLLGAFAKGRAG